MTMTMISCDPAPVAPPDLAAVKKKQQATWASGDYAVIGRTLQIVGETLCEAVDLRAGERVLDVACGNGNATLAAARRSAEVTGLDYVPSLLEGARARAAAEGMIIDLREGDAEAMPFADASFDVVLSTFGCMFTPDHQRTAREMARVTRPGGRIGVASWTREGFIGQLFAVIGRHVPPPVGVRSPALWGSEDHLGDLFAGMRIEATRKHFHFNYTSADHMIDTFRTYYGPVGRAFDALDPAGKSALDADLHALLAKFDRGGHTLLVPGEYLEAIIHRA
jgi:ubiquinone/menaquinone biosynthesis C-methylase UbiE